VKRNFPAISLAILYLVSFPHLAWAATPRETVIQKEVDCVSRHLKAQKALDWEDVCYTRESSREQEISEALDVVSGEYNEEEDVARESDAKVKIKAAPASSKPYKTQIYDVSEGPLVPKAEEVNEYEEESAAPSKKGKVRKATVPKDSPRLIIKKHTTEIGMEGSHINYKEPVFILEEKGKMYGAYLAHTVRMDPEDPLYSELIDMYKLDAKASYGKVDYSSAPSGTLEDIDDYMIEFRGVVGKDFSPDPRWLLTPYAGLGFRILNDDLGGKQTTTGAVGYQRTARYLYAPVGFEVLHQLTHGWRIGGSGEFDIFLYGRQSSYLDDVDSAYPDIHNRQRRGFGLRGSVRLVKEGEKVNFVFEPFVRYWHIKNSDVRTAVDEFVVSGLEPENSSTEYGAKLGLQFDFGKVRDQLDR